MALAASLAVVFSTAKAAPGKDADNFRLRFPLCRIRHRIRQTINLRELYELLHGCTVSITVNSPSNTSIIVPFLEHLPRGTILVPFFHSCSLLSCAPGSSPVLQIQFCCLICNLYSQHSICVEFLLRKFPNGSDHFPRVTPACLDC